MDSFRLAASRAARNPGHAAAAADGCDATAAAAHTGFMQPMRAFAEKEATAAATYQPSVLQPQRRTFAAAAAHQQRQRLEAHSRRERRPSTAEPWPMAKVAGPCTGGRLTDGPGTPSSPRLPPLNTTGTVMSARTHTTDAPAVLAPNATGRLFEKLEARGHAAAVARTTSPSTGKEADTRAWPHDVKPFLTGCWSVSIVHRPRSSTQAGGARGTEEVIGTLMLPYPALSGAAPTAAEKEGDDDTTWARRAAPATEADVSHPARRLTPASDKVKPSPVWAVTLASTNRTAAAATTARGGKWLPAGRVPSYEEVVATIEAEVARMGLALSHIMYLDEDFDNTFALLTPRTMAFCRRGVFRVIATEREHDTPDSAVATATRRLLVEHVRRPETVPAKDKAAALRADIDEALRLLEVEFERSHAWTDPRDGGADGYETIVNLLHPTAAAQPSARALAIVNGPQRAAGTLAKHHGADPFAPRAAAATDAEVFKTQSDIKWQASERFRQRLQLIRHMVSEEAVGRDAILQEERLAAIFITQYERSDKAQVGHAVERALHLSETQHAERQQQARVCKLIREVRAHSKALALRHTRKQPEVCRMPEYCSDTSTSTVADAEKEEETEYRRTHCPVNESEMFEDSHVSAECSRPLRTQRLVAAQEVGLRGVAAVPPAEPTPDASRVMTDADTETEATGDMPPSRTSLGSVRVGSQNDEAPDALTSLDITLRPKQFHLFDKDRSPLFTAMRADVAACLGVSFRDVRIDHDNTTTQAQLPRDADRAYSCSDATSDATSGDRPVDVDTTVPYEELSRSEERRRKEPSDEEAGGACVVHLVVEHDGSRADDEIQFLIATFGFPCLTQLCEDFAADVEGEKKEDDDREADEQQGTPDEIAADEAEEAAVAEPKLEAEARESCVEEDPQREPAEEEEPITNGAAEEVPEPQPQDGRQENAPASLHNESATLADDEERASDPSHGSAPAPAEVRPERAATARQEVVDMGDTAATPLVKERTAAFEAEEEERTEPAPEPEWYLEYLAMKERAKEAKAQGLVALSYEAHIEQMEHEQQQQPPPVAVAEECEQPEETEEEFEELEELEEPAAVEPVLEASESCPSEELEPDLMSDEVVEVDHDATGEQAAAVPSSSEADDASDFEELVAPAQLDHRTFVEPVASPLRQLDSTSVGEGGERDGSDGEIASAGRASSATAARARGPDFDELREPPQGGEVASATDDVDSLGDAPESHSAAHEEFEELVARVPSAMQREVDEGEEQQGRQNAARTSQSLDELDPAAPAAGSQREIPAEDRVASVVEREDPTASTAAEVRPVPVDADFEELVAAPEVPVPRSNDEDHFEGDPRAFDSLHGRAEHLVDEVLEAVVAPRQDGSAPVDAAEDVEEKEEEEKAALVPSPLSNEARPLTPEPEYTKVRSFNDLNCRRLSLAPCDKLAELCGLDAGECATLSHHHVWLRGAEWDMILDSCPLFLRDQFTSETSDLLDCPPRCIRNVVLRASAESLRIEFDLIHAGDRWTYASLEAALRGHVFHLLMELYRSRQHLALLNLDEGLEVNVPLHVGDVTSSDATTTPPTQPTTSAAASTATTGACPRPPSRLGTPGGAAAAAHTSPQPPHSHSSASTRHLPRPTSTHTNYERLSLSSSAVASHNGSAALSHLTPPATALDPTATAAAAERFYARHRASSEGCDCSRPVTAASTDSRDSIRERVHLTPLHPLVGDATTTAPPPVRAAPAPPVSPSPPPVTAPPEIHPGTFSSSSSSKTGTRPAGSRPVSGRRSTASIHSVALSSVTRLPPTPFPAEQPSHLFVAPVAAIAATPPHVEVPPSRMSAADPLTGAATATATATVAAANSSGLHAPSDSMRSDEVAPNSLTSTNMAITYSMNSLLPRLDPSAVQRPANPVYQRLSSLRGSTSPRQSSSGTNGGVAAGYNLASSKASCSHRSSANIEEVPGYPPHLNPY